VSIVAWTILGFLSGFIVSKFITRTDKGFFLDIALGIVGAVSGGWLFSTFETPGVTGINLYGLLVAVVGAVVLLTAHRALFRRTR